MNPRQLGIVLFTVLGVGLITAGVVLGAEMLLLGGMSAVRLLGLCAVPIASGYVLMQIRETLAAKYLRDEPVQQSGLVARDLVRVGVVILGIWLVVDGMIDFVTALLFGGQPNAVFPTLAGKLLSAGIGVLLVTRSQGVTDRAWGSRVSG